VAAQVIELLSQLQKKVIRQVAALSRADHGVSWAFLFNLCECRQLFRFVVLVAADMVCLYIQGRIYSKPGLVQKKMWGP